MFLNVLHNVVFVVLRSCDNARMVWLHVHMVWFHVGSRPEKTKKPTRENPPMLRI